MERGISAKWQREGGKQWCSDGQQGMKRGLKDWGEQSEWLPQDKKTLCFWKIKKKNESEHKVKTINIIFLNNLEPEEKKKENVGYW